VLGRWNGTHRFWSWFAANRERIERMQMHARASSGLSEEGAVVLDELHDRLQRYNKLVHPFGGIAADGRFELIFTAEGAPAGFPAIFQLVKAAPKLDNWRFIPLKPRMSVEGVAATDKVKLDTARMGFHLNRGHRPAALVLLIDEDPTEAWEHYQFLGQMIAMTLLGEHDFAKGVGACAVVNKGRFAERWGHEGQPLSELCQALPPMTVN